MRLGHRQGLASGAVEATVRPQQRQVNMWKGVSTKAAQCPYVVADSTMLAVGKGQPQMQ